MAEKGFPISVYNRSSDKTDAAVVRAGKEGVGALLHGYKDLKDFVLSLERPRYAGAALCSAGTERMFLVCWAGWHGNNCSFPLPPLLYLVS